MGRAGGLTGRSTGLIAVDPVFVPIILGPHVGTPGHLRGQRLFRIGHLASVLFTELLSQLYRSRRAGLHTFAAGHAVFFRHAGHIGGPGHVRRVEKLGSPQRVADIHIAVADGKNLVLAVNIGNLMDKPVLLRLTENLQGLLLRDVTASLVGLYHIIGHVSHSHAPALGVVGAALVKGFAGTAAGTGTRSVLALVFVQPVGDMLDGDGLIVHLDSLLHRNHMHTDAGAARRHHEGYLFQRAAAHALKEPAQLGMLFQHFVVHVGKFRAARHKHGKHILFLVARILPVVLDHAVVGQLLQDLLHILPVFSADAHHILQSLWLALFHQKRHLRHLIGTHHGKTDVLRRLFVDLFQAQHHRRPVRDELRQFGDGLPERFLRVRVTE